MIKEIPIIIAEEVPDELRKLLVKELESMQLHYSKVLVSLGFCSQCANPIEKGICTCGKNPPATNAMIFLNQLSCYLEK